MVADQAQTIAESRWRPQMIKTANDSRLQMRLEVYECEIEICRCKVHFTSAPRVARKFRIESFG